MTSLKAPGREKVCSKKANHIPGGVMKVVVAICAKQYAGVNPLFIPLNSGLSAGLLVSPAVVYVETGTAKIHVVIEGFTSIWLYPRLTIGTLDRVIVISLPTNITKVPWWQLWPLTRFPR